MNAPHRTPRRLALALALAATAACGPASQRGQLSVELVDAPNPDVSEIWVSVTSVRAHASPGGWTTVSDQPVTVDLLKLQTQAQALGLTTLPAGKITQLRLLVAETGNEVVLAAGGRAPLKVPSGYQSGIKIHGPWKVDACSRTSITLDFDGKRSIWYHPIGDQSEWILRPVIHTKKSSREDVACGEEPEVAEEGGTPVACPESACEPGFRCVEGQCLGDLAAPCTSGDECASGVCDAAARCGPAGAGKRCVADPECLSGACEGGACLAGGPGAPCRETVDCATGACGAEGTCASGGAGGAGAACNLNSDCLSNSCVESGCEPGIQGQPCAVAEDCLSGLCVESACEPAPAG